MHIFLLGDWLPLSLFDVLQARQKGLEGWVISLQVLRSILPWALPLPEFRLLTSSWLSVLDMVHTPSTVAYSIELSFLVINGTITYSKAPFLTQYHTYLVHQSSRGYTLFMIKHGTHGTMRCRLLCLASFRIRTWSSWDVGTIKVFRYVGLTQPDSFFYWFGAFAEWEITFVDRIWCPKAGP
jgi:hypothetical protein